jgi:hypothetical protein
MDSERFAGCNSLSPEGDRRFGPFAPPSRRQMPLEPAEDVAHDLFPIEVVQRIMAGAVVELQRFVGCQER